MRTPRDSFALNTDGDMQLVSNTPRDLKLRDMALKHQLKQGLASLPKPKDTEWELELPDEQQELTGLEELSEEDAELRDRRNREIREAQEKIEFQRRTQVMQRALPRSTVLDVDALLAIAMQIHDPEQAAIAREAALLEANDALRYPMPGSRIKGNPGPLQTFDDDALAQARALVNREVPADLAQQGDSVFRAAWDEAHSSSLLPGLSGYGDEIDEHQLLVEAFDVCTLLHVFSI